MIKKIILFSLFIIFCPVFVYAQNEGKDNLNLQVQGTAEIKRGDVAAAREKAIQDALEKSIVEAASKFSDISVKDEDFQLIKNIIIKEPEKYVLYYTITEESRQPENFIVKANVVVALLTLKNDLQKMGFFHNNLNDKNNIEVFLIVKGLRNYSEYVKIVNFLQSQTNLVKNIYPCIFEWQIARFKIDIIGNAQSLADELEKNAGCSLEINHPGINRVEMICWQNN